MNKNTNTKKTKKAISFERFVKRDPKLAKWVDDPTGFALVECGNKIENDLYNCDVILRRGRFAGWIFHSSGDLATLIGSKLLMFQNGDKMSNECLEDIREFHDVGKKPILVLFAPGTLKKCLNNPFFKMIAHRAVLIHYAK